MQKFNLNALESVNMTAANEEILNEVNGGHTMTCKYMKGVCGGGYWYWESKANGCHDGCPLGAAKFVKKWDAPNATKFEVRFDQGSVSGWHVSWNNGNSGTLVSNNTSDGSFFHY